MLVAALPALLLPALLTAALPRNLTATSPPLDVSALLRSFQVGCHHYLSSICICEISHEKIDF